MNRYHLRYREVDPTFTGIGKRYLPEEHTLEKPQFELFSAAQAGADKLNQKHSDRYYYLRGNPFTCPKCGQTKVYDGSEENPQFGDLITVQGLCQDCGNWTLFLRNGALPRYIITPDYEMYFVKEIVQVNSPARPGQDRGHFGRKFQIQRLDTMEIFYTDDLWDKGSIPEAFRSQVRPTAVILGDDMGMATPHKPEAVMIIDPSTNTIDSK